MYVINLNMSCGFITTRGSQPQISTRSRNLPGSSQVHVARPKAPLPAGPGRIVGYIDRLGVRKTAKKNNSEAHKLYDNFSSISMIAA